MSAGFGETRRLHPSPWAASSVLQELVIAFELSEPQDVTSSCREEEDFSWHHDPFLKTSTTLFHFLLPNSSSGSYAHLQSRQVILTQVPIPVRLTKRRGIVLKFYQNCIYCMQEESFNQAEMISVGAARLQGPTVQVVGPIHHLFSYCVSP